MARLATGRVAARVFADSGAADMGNETSIRLLLGFAHESAIFEM